MHLCDCLRTINGDINIDPGFLEHFQHDHFVDVVILDQQDTMTSENSRHPGLDTILRRNILRIKSELVNYIQHC